jgi:hypothetical protein
MGITFSKVEWSNAVKSFPGKLELQAPVREFLVVRSNRRIRLRNALYLLKGPV